MQDAAHPPPIAIIGAGAWGTALAICLAESPAQNINLYTRSVPQRDALLQHRENQRYLPSAILPAGVAVHSLESLRADTPEQRDALAILCVPMSGLSALMAEHGAWIARFADVLIAAKGLLPERLAFPHTLVQDALAPYQPSFRVGLISGPSFAKELAQRLPTAVTLAHEDLARAQYLCQALHRAHFRLYPSEDPMGVAVSGALKNVLAVASGLSDGLGMGENARAALLTRGLHEIGNWLVAFGGQRETLYGLSGIGDVLLTAMGDLSRNRQAGLALAQGQAIAAIRQQWGTVEGLNTALAAQQWVRQHAFDSPIIEAVADIIQGKLSGQAAMKMLMTRPLREHENDYSRK